MTIIEFFDKAAIENIAGAFLCDPERVILVGDNKKKMDRSILLYQKILEKNGKHTEFISMSANRHDLQDIVEKLTSIVETYSDCVFDLTGGEDLYLVALGIMMGRYGSGVKCHRFNFGNDTLYDCDADNKVCAVGSFDLSIEDGIGIYDGRIVTDPSRESYTYPWDFNENFENDIDTMWSICRNDPRQWNAHIGTLGQICETFKMPDELTVSFDILSVKEIFKQKKIPYVFVSGIMYSLQKHGLIRNLVIQDTVSFRFKNRQVKRCLTVAGQILELVVACKMRHLKDKDGSPLYHDVRVGVVIDWDYMDQSEAYRTINEIDVIAMKGIVPIFISCKNGDFDVDELYKLNSVAEQFGAKYAKKVLVASELEKLNEKGKYIQARMLDMNIRHILNVDEMPDNELEKKLRSL